ncbi:hypothetical protein Dimus_005341 [Dionaea muscipula]
MKQVVEGNRLGEKFYDAEDKDQGSREVRRDSATAHKVRLGGRSKVLRSRPLVSSGGIHEDVMTKSGTVAQGLAGGTGVEPVPGVQAGATGSGRWHGVGPVAQGRGGGYQRPSVALW